MTAILAINYYHQIIVVADCRVSWSTNPVKLQDNLQKVYPLGPTGVIGFAGNVASAKAIFNGIRDVERVKPLPPTALTIVEDISADAREAYSRLPSRDKMPLELMYVAADYGRISLVAENVIFAENILAKFSSPNFEPEFQSDFVALGYAVKYPAHEILQNRDKMLNFGFDPSTEKFLVGISVGIYGDGLARLAGDPVGGLFAIGIVNARDGVRWSSYSIGHLIKLEIENGAFVQYDLRDKRRVPLKVIWDFDARRPDAGNLVFNPVL